MRTIFARIAVLAILPLALLLLFIPSAQAQAENPFTALSASHNFGESLSFSAQLNTDIQADSIELTFRPSATGQSTILPAARQDTTLTVSYAIQPPDYLPPFTEIEYWFTAKLPDGSQLKSQTATLRYTDNRYQWQNLTHNDYSINWVTGDSAFGQAILDAVLETNTSFSNYLNLPLADDLDIYVYPSASSLQTALDITNVPWASGHADPAGQTILVSIPQSFDQQLLIQREIPHEVTHIRVYLYMRENYDNLPIWYSEGLASLAEQYTLPEYWQILQAARQDNTLIPLEELCDSFPYDTDHASLAYAQADSITRYIYDTYGKFGLQSLLDAYTDGHACDTGVQTGLNISLSELENNWKKEVFANAGLSNAESSVGAWAVLLGLFILVAGISFLVSKRSR